LSAVVDAVFQLAEQLVLEAVVAFHDFVHRSFVPLPAHPRPLPSFRRNQIPVLKGSTPTA